MRVLGKSNSVHMKSQKGVAKKAYNLFPDFFFCFNLHLVSQGKLKIKK